MLNIFLHFLSLGLSKNISKISSGCFSIHRTDLLRDIGGWSNRTMAEDMDLMWTLYAMGRKVRFVPEAICYPIEPHDLRFLRCQLRRWSHGGLVDSIWAAEAPNKLVECRPHSRRRSLGDPARVEAVSRAVLVF